MRRTAYIKAIRQIKNLPLKIKELTRYFGDMYNPQQEALDYVLRKARRDDRINNGELMQILNEEK